MSAPAPVPQPTPGKALLLSRALRTDGTRVKMHPLESDGRFARLQRFLFPEIGRASCRERV